MTDSMLRLHVGCHDLSLGSQYCFYTCFVNLFTDLANIYWGTNIFGHRSGNHGQSREQRR